MSNRTRWKPLVVWIATKDGVDTVHRECPNAFLRASYDNVMPFIDKTAFNLLKAELKDTRAERDEFMREVQWFQDKAKNLGGTLRMVELAGEADRLRTLLKEAERALEDIGNGAHDSFRCGEIAREALRGDSE
jgi:hypothetical protein